MRWLNFAYQQTRPATEIQQCRTASHLAAQALLGLRTAFGFVRVKVCSAKMKTEKPSGENHASPFMSTEMGWGQLRANTRARRWIYTNT